MGICCAVVFIFRFIFFRVILIYIFKFIYFKFALNQDVFPLPHLLLLRLSHPCIHCIFHQPHPHRRNFSRNIGIYQLISPRKNRILPYTLLIIFRLNGLSKNLNIDCSYYCSHFIIFLFVVTFKKGS